MPDFKETYTVTRNYIPVPSKRRPGLFIQKVRFIVAHDTGNPASTASQNVRYYINSRNEKSASAHLFVDDKEIIECVPALNAPPEKAWHVLYSVPKDNELYGVNANDAAIGVEYCYGGNIDADKAYNKYVWVLAKLCYEFQLDPSKDIVGHFFLDPKRKTDPVTGLAHSRRTYDQLLVDVVQEYCKCLGKEGLSAPRLASTGRVVVAVKLNVRKEPDTRSEIVQVLSPGMIFDYIKVINNGQSINNNSTWYEDANGNYVWSGGVK
ncbi:MAG: amidase [Chitinophagaceae bacterium]|nr:amidase [Chitinophagaceae bacterium]